jgi:triosephosphate isomerase
MADMEQYPGGEMAERVPLIAGNWKMYRTHEEAAELVGELIPKVAGVSHCEVAVCPPFTSLHTVAELLKGTNIALGAQDVYWESEGAYTGEISPLMLKAAGCRYVIVGHSERRQYFGETDATVHKKIQALYGADLIPIICVGERLEEREAGKTHEVVSCQIEECLADLGEEKLASSVIAYEPVWAIGTGRTATPEQAQEVQAMIRKQVASLYNSRVAGMLRIQYGGSVKPDNIRALMAMPDIDGALVGGASLTADSFSRIVHFA